MTENINRDICVSDTNGKVVVAIDIFENVRFKYKGIIDRTLEAFDPKDIVTDHMGQIIVADYNKCLHILDGDGTFRRLVDNCGLEKPFGLSIDGKYRLWVGLYDSGLIKVIDYLL